MPTLVIISCHHRPTNRANPRYNLYNSRVEIIPPGGRMPSSEDVSGWQTVGGAGAALEGPGLACVVSELRTLADAQTLAATLRQGVLRFDSPGGGGPSTRSTESVSSGASHNWADEMEQYTVQDVRLLAGGDDDDLIQQLPLDDLDDGSAEDLSKTPWDVILDFLTSKPLETTSKVKQLFEASDKNNDGGVDIEELMLGMSDIGLELTEAQVVAFHRDCDANGDGVVTLREFTGAVKAAKMSQDVRNKAKAERASAEVRPSDPLTSPYCPVRQLGLLHCPPPPAASLTRLGLLCRTRATSRSPPPHSPPLQAKRQADMRDTPPRVAFTLYLNDKSLTLDSLTRDQQSNLYRVLEATLGLASSQLAIKDGSAKGLAQRTTGNDVRGGPKGLVLDLVVSGLGSGKKAAALAGGIANGKLEAMLRGERAAPGASGGSAGGARDPRFDGVRCEAQDPDAPGAAKEARESKDAARFRQKATKKLFGEVEAEGIRERVAAARLEGSSPEGTSRAAAEGAGFADLGEMIKRITKMGHLYILTEAEAVAFDLVADPEGTGMCRLDAFQRALESLKQVSGQAEIKI